MQRSSSKNLPIKPVYTLAAAVLAAGVLSVSAPAFAAPIGDVSAVSTSGVILVGGRDENDNRWGGKDRDRRYQMEKGDERADRDGDWRRNDDSWNRNRRDHRGHAEGRHDRGNHYGWERGNHYGWHKNGRNSGDDGRWSDDRSDWRAERRHSRWMGQHIGSVNSSVMRDYEAYNLPRPGKGEYYARSGNEIYLVTARTQRIVDAFVLRGLVR